MQCHAHRDLQDNYNAVGSTAAAVVSIGTAASGTSITNHTERRSRLDRRQTQTGTLPFADRRGNQDRRGNEEEISSFQDVPTHLNLLDHGGVLVKKRRRRAVVVASALVSGTQLFAASGFAMALLSLFGLGAGVMALFDKVLAVIQPVSQHLAPLLKVAQAQGLPVGDLAGMLQKKLLPHSLLRRWSFFAAATMFGRGSGSFWMGATSFAALAVGLPSVGADVLAFSSGSLLLHQAVRDALPQILEYRYHFAPDQIALRIGRAVDFYQRSASLDPQKMTTNLIDVGRLLARHHDTAQAIGIKHQEHQTHQAQITEEPLEVMLHTLPSFAKRAGQALVQEKKGEKKQEKEQPHTLEQSKEMLKPISREMEREMQNFAKSIYAHSQNRTREHA